MVGRFPVSSCHVVVMPYRGMCRSLISQETSGIQGQVCQRLDYSRETPVYPGPPPFSSQLNIERHFHQRLRAVF